MSDRERTFAVAVAMLLVVMESRSVDLSCTASKIVEFNGRLADAPIPHNQKQELELRNAEITKQLMPLYAKANDIEKQHREALVECIRRSGTSDSA